MWTAKMQRNKFWPLVRRLWVRVRAIVLGSAAMFSKSGNAIHLVLFAKGT